MASKLQNICTLSDEVGKSLADYENWTAFLKSAAWQYKYPFQDQILIYAQRPDATACASIDVWNKKLKAWINRGSKGIALLREGDRGKYLDYVFDISDTHTSGSPIRLWQYNSRFDNAIIETLENSFGELKSKNSITDAIISAAQNAVEDSKSDYLSELKYAKENSFLDGLDELNIDVEFQQTAEVSIAYIVLQRLGINADNIFEREDFPHIMNFNTIPALSVLGNAVSSISEETLRNISETIRAEVREEINARKNFAEKENAVYNEVKEKDAPTINNERTDSYERDNIHGSERIPDSELDNGTSGSTDRQIRADEAEISQTEPTEPIHELDDNRQDNGASAGSTDISDRADTEDSPEIGTDRGRERGTESERPDDVDGTDEQPTPFSGRNRTAGGSLQLSLFDLIPTEEQQRETVQRAAHEIFGAAFSMPQQIIDEVLCDGSLNPQSRLDICIEFSKNKSLADKSEFLKSLYGTSGKGFVVDGRNVSAWWSEQGIRISYGNTANINTAQLISWEDAAKRIDELLDLGRYAPSSVLLQMRSYELKKAADAFWYMEKDLDYDEFPDLKDMFNEEWFKGGFPDSTKRITEMLNNLEQLSELTEITAALVERNKNEDIMRFRMYRPERVYKQLSDLQLERKTYTSQRLTDTAADRFITEDFIDKYFIDEGIYRKYDTAEFFREHTDRKERVDYLKKLHGTTYGGSHNYIHFQNSRKGIEFSLGDYSKPYGKTLVKWNDLEKRITRLIDEDKYFTAEDKEKNIPDLLKEREQQRIRSEQIAFVESVKDMSDKEKAATLPKRIVYFVNTIDKYEKDIFANNGASILLDANEFEVYDMLRDEYDRYVIANAMKKVSGAAVSVYDRNGSYHFEEEISAIKCVSFEKHGDTYELHEDEATAVSEILGLSVSDGAISFPAYALEEYAGILSDNGYIYAIHDTDEENTVDKFLKSVSDDNKAFFEGNTLKAEIGREIYSGDEIYRHILNDILSFDENGGLSTELAYDAETVENLKKYAARYGVEITSVNENIQTRISKMSDDEKESHIGYVEINLDYSRNDLLTDDDMALYRALIEERFEKENQPQQSFSEYLAELHKDDNGSKTVALIPLGDFYESYGGDAENAAQVLDIVLTSKQIEDNTYKMCGFPKHILDEYANKLLYAGYDVVIADENRKYNRLLSADKIIPEQAQQTENEPKQAETPQTSEPEENAESLVGTELTIDDRKFVVDSVNTDFNKASLKDITFQNSTGFPIFRSESIDFVKSIIAEQAKPQLTAEFQKAKPQRVQNTVVYPEIPLSERRNFQITNDELGYGTPKEKFKRNIEAVNLLHNLEFEHRLATPEEQEILSQYVGWGGLADAFDETKENWSEEFKELYTTLSPDEYEQARASTLTAHFTPPVVIKAMYKALSNMGFTQGNILEPSCGIGNFMGLLPESMSGSKMYGVEIDSITGRIAGQLYQKNSVAIQGYENSELPDSFFDVAIGNVPFGDFKLLDKKYNKHNFLIHDYFFAKTLDKVRPGGVIAFITSSGTMDKRTSKVRRYIAQRADLIGAVRLPNNTFKKNAGTEVTADILFLQKRERMTDIMPEWVEVGEFSEGQFVNKYFLDNPDMVMGELKEVSGPFGPTLTCEPNEDISLAEQLDGAIQNIHAQITEYEFDDISNDEEVTIPADPAVRNFSFTVVDGNIYFRENSIMRKVEMNATAENRVKGMIELRDCVRTLIEYQTENYSDDEIKAQQAKLNMLYDNYTKKYGLINSRGNSLAFSEDSSYFLLCSLEVLDEYGELERKADMFTKRTIRAKHEVTKVDTADEALAVSLAEKAKIDIAFMEKLSGKTEQQLYEDLHGVIFLNPEHEISPEYEPKYLTADEYLSGNVREKLSQAEQFSKDSFEYRINAEYLQKVQPKDLTPGEISVKLGTTWIPEKYIEEFVFELLSPNYYAQSKIEVKYSNLTGEWNIQGKSADKGVKATNTYGTSRISAYKIIEDSLNLRDVRIFDYIYDENGNKVAKLNIKETTIAQQKQASIKQAFEDWIWKDPDRRDDLCKIYNVRFNSIRPREYDGSHITFNGINPEITLRKHQKDAVARIMYGGNSLLGHVVGAGKTWTMVAAAMESRRLGLCNKSLFVVPNHLTEQWASEFLQLYPAANILVATKKDFEMKNRKKFCGRIATGDYDAVIIGHSQFEKIPMSAERQKTILQNQLDEIINGIIEAKTENAERYTVKQMEKTKRGLEAKIKKLNDQERKDDVVTFEEIGVDRVFVDEAHFYKNLFLYTKMRNVGGIAQTEAQKSSDLFMKTQYLDELTGGKGVIFATGTPVSNSMVELYTMQRYLQYKSLQERGLQHFDSWASTFGETVSAMELAPEGSGYRMKTRFAKFFNLPELIAMFKEVADIQTADMLKLPVPEVEYHNEVAEPTQFQKDMVADLGERAEAVRNRSVDPSIDNMLKITNDGRKLALDQRMINPMLPDDETSKVSVCADRVYDIWKDTADRKATQLLFCDLSTPKSDGTFSVYNSIREKLLQKGIPENEIAFIHDANTEVKKDELFKKVRSGDVRVLLGSTSKMGAGTNVQKLLYASHDLDCPWRPADLEQRAGRIIRQGNTNEKVHIYRYVTKGTFDTYMWQTVEQKQKFISQIFTSKSPVRVADDIDPTALSFAEIKALSTGNPHIKEKMELDMEVSKLKLIKSSFMSQIYDLEDKVVKFYPKQIAEIAARIKGLEKDIETVKQYPKAEDKFNTMTIDGFGYFEKEKAGNALIERCKKMTSEEPVNIGDYRGFSMELSFDSFQKLFYVTLVGSLSHKVELGTDVFGNIQRIDNVLDGFEKRLEFEKEKLANTNTQYETAKVEAKRAFPQEAELQEKTKRLAAVEALLKMDKKDDNVIDTDVSDAQVPQQKREYAMAR